MSSRPGRTRCSRAARSARRASASPGGALAERAERDVEDVPALEVPGRAHAPVAEQPLDLVGGDPARPPSPSGRLLVPDVEAAFLALGVGVERRVEAALGAAHLAQRPVERLARHVQPALARPSAGSRAGRRGRAARCRRASSRSAARASARRPCSGRSRRRPGRRCRRTSSRRGCGRRARARRGPSGTRARWRGGNFGAPPKPPLRVSAATSRLPDRRVEQRRRELVRRLLHPRRRRPVRRARGPRRRGTPRAGPRKPSAVAWRTCWKLGSPWRGSGGKYVPP